MPRPVPIWKVSLRPMAYCRRPAVHGSGRSISALAPHVMRGVAFRSRRVAVTVAIASAIIILAGASSSASVSGHGPPKGLLISVWAQPSTFHRGSRVALYASTTRGAWCEPRVQYSNKHKPDILPNNEEIANKRGEVTWWFYAKTSAPRSTGAITCRLHEESGTEYASLHIKR